MVLTIYSILVIILDTEIKHFHNTRRDPLSALKLELPFN